MSFWRLITRSLRYYWRTNLAVAAGIAVAVAVLVGSLVVGDSVTGSLRQLALGRLGRTEYALEHTGYFRRSLAQDLRATASLSDKLELCVPAMILDASAKDPRTAVVIPRVAVFGVTDGFWKLAETPVPVALSGREVAVNRWLAEDLNVSEGDGILVSVGRRGAAPMGTVFGRRSREDTVRTRRLVVRSIIPEKGAGAFTLRADRPRPRNIYVSLPWLQQQLEQPDRINALLVAAVHPVAPDLPKELRQALASVLTLADYDLEFVAAPGRNGHTLRSTRMVLPPAVVRAAERAAADTGLVSGRQSVYLANSIFMAGTAGKGAATPYSLIGAREGLDDATPPDGMRLTDWLTADLAARPGDELEGEFYVSGPRGELRTVTRRFRVTDVLPLQGLALDRRFVPELEGMTDATDMSDWDPPFPIDTRRIRAKDEDYWDRYRATPKAYVSLEAIRRLWRGEGTGAAAEPAWVTGVNVTVRGDAGPLARPEVFTASLLKRLSPEEAGLAFRPVRTEALAAANASTDFGMLFLSMSFFLVASAAGLIWLLLRLTIDRRASQIGILLASGFTQKAAARILIGEAMQVAVGGLIVGVPLGIVYAWGILAALRGNWSGAVAEFPLGLHVTAASVLIGALSGLAVSTGAIVLSSRILRRLSALVLLGGWRAVAAQARGSSGRVAYVIGTAALAVAAGLLIAWGAFQVLPAAAAFSSSGALILVGCLALFSGILQRRAGEGVSASRLSLARLALRGVSRHWVRSLLTVGLLACATLLIVTVAAFRRDPARAHPGPKDSGTGGFHLLARSELPIYADLNTDDGRRKLGFAPEGSQKTAGAHVFAFRKSDGGDISCLNLQRPKAPRVLGVPPEMVARGGFRFSASELSAADLAGPTETGEPAETPPHNVWQLLNPHDVHGAIPAFADADTAQWQLKVGLGDVLSVPTPDGREVSLRIVGLMPGSIFAGELLVSEANFTKHFGTESGYRFFLIECADGTEDEVKAVLRETLGELGFDVRRTSDVLAAYADVQNTYLSAFETLGGLGLLLATFGIVTVLLRSVVERRAELAMMLAVGFRTARLTAMVLLENALLLVIGVAIGTVAALVAAAPQLTSTVADVRWMSLAFTLAATVAVGLVSCTLAARASVRGELIAALRSE